jgi:hypothetical protein
VAPAASNDLLPKVQLVIDDGMVIFGIANDFFASQEKGVASERI